MRSSSLIAALLGALLALTTACGDWTRPVPPPTPPPGVPLVPPVGLPPFPAVSGTAQVYVSTGSLNQLYSGSYAENFASRFVLYADGTFSLQFVSRANGFFEYTGRYARTDSRITFDWDGWSSAGPWGATGTLSGDILHVEYNDVMQMTDFIDGDYVRVAATP